MPKYKPNIYSSRYNLWNGKRIDFSVGLYFLYKTVNFITDDRIEVESGGEHSSKMT